MLRWTGLKLWPSEVQTCRYSYTVKGADKLVDEALAIQRLAGPGGDPQF